MNAIDELRQRVAAKAEQEKQEQEARHEAEIERVRVVAVAQFGQALLDELNATFRRRDRYVEMVLVYRGEQKAFPVNTHEGLRRDFGMTPAERIAAWVNGVDRAIAEREMIRANARREWLANLRGGMRVYIGGDHYARHRITEAGLLDDPEVAEALVAYEAQVAALVAAQKAKEAEGREARKRERQAERARLLEIAATAQTWDALYPLSDRVEDDMYGRGDFSDDAEMVAAYEAARERVTALEAQREKALAAAQTAAFHPFTFYRVTMGIVGVLDGEAIVDTATFDTLSDTPDERGFWHPVDRDWPVRVHNLVHVEQVTVSEPEAMPRWCAKVETEWGAIRVPPGSNGQ
jgi:hypothetical protein